MGSLALLPGALPPLLEATPFPDELLTCSFTADSAVKSKTVQSVRKADMTL